MTHFHRAFRVAAPFARWGAALAAGAALAGCYVVPIQPPAPAAPTYGVHAAPLPLPMPGPVTFTARLYPANELAA
ncbi:MAG TPA: lytic murein transglycosylase, partial [Ramlibacter sp.]